MRTVRGTQRSALSFGRMPLLKRGIPGRGQGLFERFGNEAPWDQVQRVGFFFGLEKKASRGEGRGKEGGYVHRLRRAFKRYGLPPVRDARIARMKRGME